MYEVHQVGGHIGGECFLVLSGESAVLLDSGFGFSAVKTADAVERHLAGRRLDYILATHSHYDHVSGAAFLKRRFPGVQIAGSRHAASVLSHPNARALMRSLNSIVRARGTAHADVGADSDAVPDCFDELAVDVILDDGDELAVPGMPVRAIATPGHTHCSMSYFFPDESLLACSETIGVAPSYPEVTPCVIVGYRATLASFEKSLALDPRHVLVSHTGLVPKGEIPSFFAEARRVAVESVDLLLALHRKGCDEEEIVRAFREKYYPASAALQPEEAFVINTKAMIVRVLRELGE